MNFSQTTNFSLENKAKLMFAIERMDDNLQVVSMRCVNKDNKKDNRSCLF